MGSNMPILNPETNRSRRMVLIFPVRFRPGLFQLNRTDRGLMVVILLKTAKNKPSHRQYHHHLKDSPPETQ